ncbi:conserved hypothetical protein [Cupriavidus phytorum]|uniref:Uncharacterized protein n=1 Tax=Cupriavidus taiwanensis TaxID=164546 RepID=A0A975X8E8_9BURK|nr:conserved hypothetical protein [Cupriavidus taiwanensis]
MATKLTQYILSQQFQEAAARGIEKAVAKTRAAGLLPAGDSHIKPTTKPPTVTTIPEPMPSRKGKGAR